MIPFLEISRRGAVLRGKAARALSATIEVSAFLQGATEGAKDGAKGAAKDAAKGDEPAPGEAPPPAPPVPGAAPSTVAPPPTGGTV